MYDHQLGNYDLPCVGNQKVKRIYVSRIELAVRLFQLKGAGGVFSIKAVIKNRQSKRSSKKENKKTHN